MTPSHAGYPGLHEFSIPDATGCFAQIAFRAWEKQARRTADRLSEWRSLISLTFFYPNTGTM
jgi:hypothetical protein